MSVLRPFNTTPPSFVNTVYNGVSDCLRVSISLKEVVAALIEFIAPEKVKALDISPSPQRQVLYCEVNS